MTGAWGRVDDGFNSKSKGPGFDSYCCSCKKMFANFFIMPLFTQQ